MDSISHDGLERLTTVRNTHIHGLIASQANNCRDLCTERGHNGQAQHESQQIPVQTGRGTPLQWLTLLVLGLLCCWRCFCLLIVAGRPSGQNCRIHGEMAAQRDSAWLLHFESHDAFCVAFRGVCGENCWNFGEFEFLKVFLCCWWVQTGLCSETNNSGLPICLFVEIKVAHLMKGKNAWKTAKDTQKVFSCQKVAFFSTLRSSIIWCNERTMGKEQLPIWPCIF